MKPMLAATLRRPEDIRFPVMGSPKLDGVRCLIIDGVAMSRSFKPIPNAYVQHLFGREELNGLDGELIVGEPTDKDCYRETVSGVMRQGERPDVTFWVFDDYSHPGGFTARLEASADKSSLTPAPIVSVGHTLIHNVAELEMFEQDCLSRGYEGAMIRSINGPYKHGRSTENEGYLLKVKRFADCEAEVIGFDEKMHNANEATINELGHTHRSSHKANQQLTGVLGALKVRGLNGPYEGVEFDIGTGFNDFERNHIWINREALTGSTVKVKYFPTGSKDKPRFPTFLGFRPLGA
jgi:DNA ligase-1